MNKVRVMIRAKVGGKYPYLPAVINSNGRIKPGVALVGGVERKVQGSYHLRFTDGGYRRWKPLGKDAAEAMNAARKIEATLRAKTLGVAVQSSLIETPSERIKLADAIAEYKAETKEHKSDRTYLNYAHALDLFAKGCPKTYVDEVGRVSLWRSQPPSRRVEMASAPYSTDSPTCTHSSSGTAKRE